MNFYKRYPGDYMRDTGHLTLAEHGAYALMLDIAYSNDSAPLPEGKSLYRLLRADTAQEKKAVNSVVNQFWIKTPDGLINDRVQGELEKAKKRRHINRANGSKGGRPKETESVSESENQMGYLSVNKNNPLQNQHQIPDTRYQITNLTKGGKSFPRENNPRGDISTENVGGGGSVKCDANGDLIFTTTRVVPQ